MHYGQQTPGRTSGPQPERRWLWYFAATVMGLTLVPYLAGYTQAGAELAFTGFVFGVDDGNSYIAKMLSGSAGAWIFRSPYTPYPQQGVLALQPYIFLGKLAAPPASHEQLVALFHLFRIAAGFLAIFATYDFLALFLNSRSLRRWALVLTTVGGGLGWALVLSGNDFWLGSLPLDFYSPESFGFLALYGLPHLAMARALLLWALAAYLVKPPAGSIPGHVPEAGGIRALFSRLGVLNRDSRLYVGVCLLLLGLFQPLTVVIAWTLMGIHLAAGWIGLRLFPMANEVEAGLEWMVAFKRAFWGVVISSPIVLYTLVKFSLDPFLREWTAQNLILSPHPAHYLVAYGLLFPFVPRGLRLLFRDSAWRTSFLAMWLLLLPFLAYAPYNLQRRLPEGIWVALVIVACGGLPQVGTSWAGRWLGKIWTGLALPSTLLLLAGGLLAALGGGPPVFRPGAEVRVFERLAEEAQPNEIVLAAFETGNALPAWAPLRVVIGHGPESIYLDELRPRVASFYEMNTTDTDRQAFLQAFDVHYVFWGPAEQELGAWDPRFADYLKLLTREGDFWVFEVQD